MNNKRFDGFLLSFHLCYGLFKLTLIVKVWEKFRSFNEMLKFKIVELILFLTKI